MSESTDKSELTEEEEENNSKSEDINEEEIREIESDENAEEEEHITEEEDEDREIIEEDDGLMDIPSLREKVRSLESDLFNTERKSEKALAKQRGKFERKLKDRKKQMKDKNILLETKNQEITKLKKDMDVKKVSEELPWKYTPDYDSLTSKELGDHISLLQKALTGYAVCVDQGKNYWLRYDWIQKLWVYVPAEGMIPFVTKFILECDTKLKKKQNGQKIYKKLYNDDYLLSLIRKLTIFLPDDVSPRLNTNANLLPVGGGNVFEITPSRMLRNRTRTDYFSVYYEGGKLKSGTVKDIPQEESIVLPPDSFELFIESEEMEITKNPNHKSQCGLLHKLFCEWCEENEYEKINARQFTIAMRCQGVDKKRHSARGFCWIGVRTKKDLSLYSL